MPAWTQAAKIRDWRITVGQQSIGGAGRGGHYYFVRGAGARWVADIDVPPMCSADALAFQAFLHGLRGHKPFDFRVPGAVQATSPATATSAGSGSTSIALTSISDASRVVAGEWMHVGALGSGQLVQIVSVSGATCVVRPRLRTAFSVGTTVTIGNVQARFRLLGDVPRVPLILGRSREVRISIEEVY